MSLDGGIAQETSIVSYSTFSSEHNVTISNMLGVFLVSISKLVQAQFFVDDIIYTYMRGASVIPSVDNFRFPSFLWANWAETWVGGGGTP